MKQGHILIASCNSNYNIKTAEAIAYKLPDLVCEAMQITDQGADVVQTRSRSEAENRNYDICFGHSRLFFQSDNKHCQDKQTDPAPNELRCGKFKCDVRFFVPFGNDGFCRDQEGHKDLAWPAPLSQLIFQIELLLTEESEKSVIRKGSDAIADNQVRGIRLGLHLGIGADSSKWLQKEILSEIGHGRQVYYLPLMPSYLMTMVSEPDKCGSNLSDLLLAIHQNCPPEINNLGKYAQMHPQGYLQFRPPDRADDLTFCDADDLRQLVVMLRQKSESQAEGCTTWIDCRGLPLSTAAKLAVLCDCLAVCIPCRDDYASKTARRELGLLMARLPGSCEILEIEGDNHYDA
jgi:hypothetical protein